MTELPRFPLIPLPIKEAVLQYRTSRGYESFPLIPLPIKEVADDAKFPLIPLPIKEAVYK